MFTTSYELRVRYSETDRMGYAYYGNYAQYFEVARVEALRTLGLSYKQLEDEGILLPVRDFQVRYLHPAFYDDLLTIETSISELQAVRIRFDYKVLNEAKQLLSEASTTLIFVDKEKGRPTKAPDYFTERLKPFFK